MERSTIAGPVGRLAVWHRRGDTAALPPTLLVHGNSMTAGAWSPVIDALDVEREIVAFDLRGHGQSVHEGPYGAAAYADDALAVLDAFGIERAHVVGGLFGGMAACVLAAQHPERVASLAMFGSAPQVELFGADEVEAGLREMGVRGFHEWQLPQAFPPGVDPALVQQVIDGASDGRSLETTIAASRAAFSADVSREAAAVSAPTLVVNGEHDPACTPELGRELARLTRGVFVCLDGVGHVPMLEAPAEVARLVHEHWAAVEQVAD